MSRRALPLPVRFLLLVLLVVVAPLTYMGYWLAGTASRSGEDLLRSRLRETNRRVAAEVAGSWLGPRSALLAFGDAEAVQDELARRPEGGRAADAPAHSLETLFEALPTSVQELGVVDAAGAPVWRFARPPEPVPTFVARIPVHAARSGRLLGWLEARLAGDAVLAAGGGAGAAGAVVGIVDPAEGASLRALPFDPSLLAAPRFEWDGETWVTERRVLLDPRLDVVSAAPLAEFAAPFEGAARRGLAVLMGVALLAATLAAVMTRRMTGSLARLAAAADRVREGELAVRVPSGGGDEVGRVAEAFNRMAESLRRTLAELAQREALAAVGSFASELAHEVRNPLTSIKMDLQFVEERLQDGSEAKGVQQEALKEVERLDRTVAGVLEIARSGRIELGPVDLRQPLEAAAHAVEPLARGAGATLRLETPAVPLEVLGDPHALRQLFTNLMVNATQAVHEGGRIDARAWSENGRVTVEIRDDGRGIPGDLLAKVGEPFFSTRPDGTGLGLAIAHRVAAAHRAELVVDSEIGKGTVVALRLASAGTLPHLP